MRKNADLKHSRGEEGHTESEMAKEPETGAGPVHPNYSHQGVQRVRDARVEEEGTGGIGCSGGARTRGSQAIITS